MNAYLTKARLIDNNFYRLTAKEAKALCGGRLPRVGYDKRVAVDGYLCWVEQTVVGGRVVWALHNSYDKAD
jgi:hypothetical protein